MSDLPDTIINLQSLVDDWVKDTTKENEDKIHKILNSWEYQQLPYEIRNKPFVTGSKLNLLKVNPYFANMKYNELQKSCKKNGANYFKIGLAVDTLSTYGEKEYGKRFMVKNRPTKDHKKEAEEKNQMILTESEGALVQECYREYKSRHFFPGKPLKTNILAVVNGLPCKAELDHFDPENFKFGDVKCMQSVTSFFSEGWRMYRIQLGFYFRMAILWAENNIDEVETFRRKLVGELYVVDKNPQFSRSHNFTFTNATLNDMWGEVSDLLARWKICEESCIWPWNLNLESEDDIKIFMESDYWPILDEFKDQIHPMFI